MGMISNVDAKDFFTLNWVFAGDLRDLYSIGDYMELQFTVEKEFEYDNHEFENLDYCIEGMKLEKEGKYPLINDYLV